MYISAKQIAGSKVFDSEGQPVGRLARVILDPDNGQILAFELIKRSPKYLSPRDLVSWKKNYLILGQNYEIHSGEDLIRLQKVLRSGRVDIIGRKVRTESGTYVGIVTDCSLHTNHYVLASITTQKSFLGLWYYDTRLIHQSQIVEIKPRQIIVRDSLLKLPAQSSPDEFAPQSSPTFDRALSVPEDRTCH
jgi:sporulation protein YlmC with PRC-barrel domain